MKLHINGFSLARRSKLNNVHGTQYFKANPVGGEKDWSELFEEGKSKGMVEDRIRMEMTFCNTKGEWLCLLGWLSGSL